MISQLRVVSSLFLCFSGTCGGEIVDEFSVIYCLGNQIRVLLVFGRQVFRFFNTK